MLTGHAQLSVTTQPLVVLSPKLNTFEDAEDLYADRACSAFGLYTALRSGVTKT